MRPHGRALALFWSVLASACGTTEAQPARARPGPPISVGSEWFAGDAELAGYRLTYPRYGELRRGTAVTVFVTEPFVPSVGVKDETAGRPAADRVTVMKLNLLQEFPAGIYDYHLMTSSFVALDGTRGLPPGSLTKASFSAQDWCGQTYGQVRFDGDTVRLDSHSYFDGEADQSLALPREADGLAEDALLHWARGFAAPALRPGESRRVRLLRSLETSRMEHVAVTWADATLGRSTAHARVRIPAGEIEVETYTVEIAASSARRTYPPSRPSADLPARRWEILVEVAAPHRLVGWSRDDGLEARLVAAVRRPYWTMNGTAWDGAVRDLGLEPLRSRAP